MIEGTVFIVGFILTMAVLVVLICRFVPARPRDHRLHEWPHYPHKTPEEYRQQRPTASQKSK